MALLLTPRHFVTKMEENVKRVDNRVNDYIKDSNENNIHDIRTATRRLDASFRSLPKKMRRKNKICKYITTSKRLFKVNSQVRDYDIICEKLQKYSSEPIYTKLTGSLNRRRKRLYSLFVNSTVCWKMKASDNCVNLINTCYFLCIIYRIYDP